MYLLHPNFFILTLLHITSIRCEIRTTMEEDIEHTNYATIHKYDPHRVHAKLKQMHFHQNFPVSKTIIYPLKQLLQQLERDVYHNMFTQIQQELNETEKNNSKILNKQLLTAISPQVSPLDNLNITANTSELPNDKKKAIQRKIDTTLPDATEKLEHVIQNVFQKLSDLYKNRTAVGIVGNRVYKPGYCYVFGICSPIFCNCDNKA